MKFKKNLICDTMSEGMGSYYILWSYPFLEFWVSEYVSNTSFILRDIE